MVFFFLNIFYNKKLQTQVYCSSYLSLSLLLIYLFLFLINLSVRLYTSAATGSRVKKTGFFIFNGIKNKEKSIFFYKV